MDKILETPKGRLWSPQGFGACAMCQNRARTLVIYDIGGIWAGFRKSVTVAPVCDHDLMVLERWHPPFIAGTVVATMSFEDRELLVAKLKETFNVDGVQLPLFA